MLILNLMSIQFMADNDTINWTDHIITIRHNIKLIHITINNYSEYSDYTYVTTISKKHLDIVYNWNKFMEYWNKNSIEYNKVFNIEFNKLILGVDYLLAPIYITNNNLYIGIYILNNKIIQSIKDNKNKKSYSFLSRIEPYLLSNTKHNTKNINKYNFFYGILSNNNDEHLKNKDIIIYMKLDTNLDTKISIPLKYILQNSMNYLPKLEINRIKMSSQNLLNP